MTNRVNMVKFSVRFKEGSWHGYASEMLWASPIPERPGFVEVQNTPFFAEGISFGDIVEVQTIDDVITFKRVVEKSGHCTYRALPADCAASPFVELLARLNAQGISYESGLFNDSTYYAFDCVNADAAATLYAALEKAEAEGLLEFSEGDYAPNFKG